MILRFASNEIDESDVETRYTPSTKKPSGFQVRLHHKGLDETKTISAPDVYILQDKAHSQERIWNAKWEKVSLQDRMRSKENDAKTQTAKELQRIADLENLLKGVWNKTEAINWEGLKNKRPYSALPPHHDFIKFRKTDGYPEEVIFLSLAVVPKQSSYFLPISFWSKLFGQKSKIFERQTKAYEQAMAEYEKQTKDIEKENSSRLVELQAKQNLWNASSEAYEIERDRQNSEIDLRRQAYEQKAPTAIVEYCEMVLNNSQYPENFPKAFDIEFNDQNSMLLVDYRLPSLSDVSPVIGFKFVKSRNESEAKTLSEAAHAKLYDSIVYQVTLRTIYELFSSDAIDAIKAINFNGIVTDIDKSTGRNETHCILSVQIQKDNFKDINLDAVDPKQCFKSFKGVGSSKLSAMVPIQPILTLNKADRRFVVGYDVIDSVNEKINLAAMDWEDFENLVRDVFEKEFAVNGGEVKVTQVSSDGGVDAVAFDPDPIRGGKIVIQAKRYTNTVGVSAVRDLYGTVMNEGATKGILVTTADYGPDSYEFAKGKPLTLLTGSNLLALLEKHGHQAKIDLREAKKILKSQSA